MKVRKKPLIVDAVQLTWSNWDEICRFVPKPWFVRGVWLDKDGNPLPEDQWHFGENNDDLGLIIQTLETNEFLARGNDWIIRGVKGEFYPCKPDVFAESYEVLAN
ncbi:MAG TPA: hypothetical protein VGG62_16230 [Terracidiphilus sp.]|jgi:hypothetical protein